MARWRLGPTEECRSNFYKARSKKFDKIGFQCGGKYIRRNGGALILSVRFWAGEVVLDDG
jgi:hypothetical protein